MVRAYAALKPAINKCLARRNLKHLGFQCSKFKIELMDFDIKSQKHVVQKGIAYAFVGL